MGSVGLCIIPDDGTEPVSVGNFSVLAEDEETGELSKTKAPKNKDLYIVDENEK